MAKRKTGQAAARKNRVIYSLCVEDLQCVAEEVLERPLTSSEIEAVEDKVGDNIDWYGAVEAAIADVAGNKT